MLTEATPLALPSEHDLAKSKGGMRVRGRDEGERDGRANRGKCAAFHPVVAPLLTQSPLCP